MFCSVQQTSWALPLRKSSRWMTGSKAEGHKLVMGASGRPIWGFLFGGSVWETCQRKSVLWWALLGWISSMYAKKCVCVCVCVCVCLYLCLCVCISAGAIWELKAWVTCGWGERQAGSLGCKEQQGLSPSGMCQIYRTFSSHSNTIHTPWEVLSNFPWYVVEGVQVGFEDTWSSCYKLLLFLCLVCSGFLDVSSENLEREEWRGF